MNMQQQEEQEIQQQEWKPTWSNLSLAALGTFTTMGLEAAHNPELALLSGVLSVVATWKGDDAINLVSSLFSQQGRAELGAKLSRKPYALTQPKEDDNVTRILPETNNATYASFDLDDEDEDVLPTQSRSQKKDLFRFSDLLNAGFVPTVNKIFVGRTMEGKDLFVAAEDLCHVALAGRTGGGKGSLMRLIMAQVCYIGARVLLLNPHYMKWVRAKDGAMFDEDWTPFEGVNPRTKAQRPYLEVPPVDCADFEPIGHRLEWVVQTLLQQRKVEGRNSDKLFKPFFIILDEWPSIADEIRDAPTHLSKLLREGRKYGVFVIIASQDFQVKTVGLDSGSVRKCLLTTYYTGGDLTTAKELLNERVQDIPENELGKGVVLLRCHGVPKATLVRVPFVDNESIYKLLGPSTFKKATHKIPDLPQREVRPVATDGATSLLPETIMVTPERFPDWFQNGQLIPSPYYEQTAQMPWQQPTQQQPVQRVEKQPTIVVQSETSNRMAADVNLVMAVKVWNNVHPSVRDMEAIFDLNNNQARRLRKMIKEHPDAEQWDLSE